MVVEPPPVDKYDLNYITMNFTLDEFMKSHTCDDFSRLTKTNFKGYPAYVFNGQNFEIIYTKINNGLLEIGDFYGSSYKNFQDLSSAFNTVISTFKFIK